MPSELPREVPLWLCRPLPGPEGPPREVLVVSTAGNKQTGLYSHVEQVLAVFVDDAAAEIENYDVPNEADPPRAFPPTPPQLRGAPPLPRRPTHSRDGSATLMKVRSCTLANENRHGPGSAGGSGMRLESPALPARTRRPRRWRNFLRLLHSLLFLWIFPSGCQILVARFIIAALRCKSPSLTAQVTGCCLPTSRSTRARPCAVCPFA